MEAFRNANHVYTLGSHPHFGFFTGVTSAGTQIIVGITENATVCLTFLMNGILHKKETKQLSKCLDAKILQDLPGLADPELEVRIKDIGLKPGTIRVLKFFESELEIGISDLPDFCLRFLQDKTGFLLKEDGDIRASEIREIESIIQQWRTDGTYVFHWFNDFYVNSRGEVVSS